MKRTAKKGMEINFINRTILVTKSFEEKARIPGSRENEELMEAIQKYEGFKVEINDSKPKKNGKKMFTFKQMEEFINAYYPEDIEEYNEVKELFVLHGTKYQNTLKWFKARYENDKRIYSRKELKEKAKIKVAKVPANRPVVKKADVETAMVH